MGDIADQITTPRRPLPSSLTKDIERAGYYPALVADVVESAVAGGEVVSHLVHQETTFDHDTVRRHITVLALTPTRLVVAHADDHAGEDDPDEAEDTDPQSVAATATATATATSECVPLSAVRGVMLTHVVASPATYTPGSLGRELTLTLGWGAVSRIDMIPATCGDPNCEADHGYEGTVTTDDIGLRISADADGGPALAQAIIFARALSAAIGG
ncbi:MAG: phosphodiesterase [Dermatophilaceae bacterium]|nr:phosphodiesterase [Dermatophilaceae bacterium]